MITALVEIKLPEPMVRDKAQAVFMDSVGFVYRIYNL
jgi:hypothetical protein